MRILKQDLGVTSSHLSTPLTDPALNGITAILEY